MQSIQAINTVIHTKKTQICSYMFKVLSWVPTKTNVVHIFNKGTKHCDSTLIFELKIDHGWHWVEYMHVTFCLWLTCCCWHVYGCRLSVKLNAALRDGHQWSGCRPGGNWEKEKYFEGGSPGNKYWGLSQGKKIDGPPPGKKNWQPFSENFFCWQPFSRKKMAIFKFSSAPPQIIYGQPLSVKYNLVIKK